MENMCCAASAAADPAFLGSSSSCLCSTVPSSAKLGVVYYHSIRYVSGTTTSNTNGLVNRGLHLFVYYYYDTNKQAEESEACEERRASQSRAADDGRAMRNLTVPRKRLSLRGDRNLFQKFKLCFCSASPCVRCYHASWSLENLKKISYHASWSLENLKKISDRKIRELGTGVVLLIIHNKIKLHISSGRK